MVRRVLTGSQRGRAGQDERRGPSLAAAPKDGHDLAGLAAWINPIVAGWMNYYGRFYRSRLYPLLQRINTYLMRWAGKKYKRLRGFRRFHAWWLGIVRHDPALFAHWRWVRTLTVAELR